MLAYLIRRLLLLIPVLIGVLTLVFLMRALVPGDPIEIMFRSCMVCIVPASSSKSIR